MENLIKLEFPRSVWFDDDDDAMFFIKEHKSNTYLYDLEGNFLFKAPYFFEEESYACNLWSYQGNKLIPTPREYHEIYTDLPERKCAIVYIKENGRKLYSIVDVKGYPLFDFEFEDLNEEWLGQDIRGVYKNGKLGFINGKGQQLTDFVFFTDNIDRNWMLHPHYDLVYYNPFKNFDMEYVGVIDWNGKLIIPVKYKHIYVIEHFADDFDIYPYDENGKALYQKFDKIYLTDFDNKRFIWTYHKGLQENYDVLDKWQWAE